MVTVGDLARKLMSYANAAEGNGKVEVMVQFDGDTAFSFDIGTEETAFSGVVVEKFLVLRPDIHGKKLVLKGRE